MAGPVQAETDVALRIHERSSLDLLPNFPSPEAVFLQSWAESQAGPTSTAMKEMLKQAQDPEMRYFAGGLPAVETFPTPEVLQTLVETACSRYGVKNMLQYGESAGLLPFRELLASWAAELGFRPPRNGDMIDSIMIGVGSQQLLKFVGEVFIDPGDPVVVEAPTYLGALQAWKDKKPTYIPVATDGLGTKTEDLERIFKTYRVKFYYANHRYSNPGGTTAPAERLEKIVWLCQKYGIPCIEDGPYDLLNFTGDVIPSLQELDEEGLIIRLNTFSKYVAPGLRLGWTVAPPKVVEKFINVQQGDAMFAPTLSQAVAAVYLKDGFLEKQLPKTVALYRERNEVMGQALAAEMPKGVTWTDPSGGMFRWIRLPESINTSALLPRAVARKVAYVPGAAFFAVNPQFNTFRLCFSNSHAEGIRSGIHDLAEVIKEELARLPQFGEVYPN